MKAIQYISYGNSAVIKLNQVDKPVPQDDEVLIRIAATTINPMDMKIRSGFLKDLMSIEFPYTPGLDMAGVVEEAGSKTHRIKTGDQVFGVNFGGTYAEYMIVKEEQVSTIPVNISLNEAAALAVPLVTAHSFLIENAKLVKGQKVLVHAAAGGTGMVVVQMAKALGAYVIGTASGEGIDLVKSFHADEVIDHKTQDFTELVKDADLVIDLVGGDTQTKSFEVLKKGGLLLSAVMPPSQELAEKYQVSAQFVSSQPSYQKLDYGKTMVEKGQIETRIKKVMQLEDAAEAQELVTAGGLNGKVVLAII